MNTHSIYEALKRIRDVSFGGAALSISFPLIAVGALAVKLDSTGPAFYRSLRVGKNGRPFHLLKLRSMHVVQDSAAPLVTAGSDTRITRVGRWLRRTKLDELPQLWNVVVGDVSLVGPRPEVKRYIDKYPQQYKEILSVRPGLTDRATLQFVDEETVLAAQENPERYYVENVLPQKIELYLDYVRNPSLCEDNRIILATLGQIICRVLRR